MKKYSGFGWLELVIGILFIVLSIFTFANPGFALTSLVILFGIAAIVMGIADILLYVRMERFTGFGPIISLISGILSVMCGAMLLIAPGAGRLVLSVLFPIWFIAHCISRLAHLGHIHTTAGDIIYYVTLILNMIGLILGFLMILDPLLSLLSVNYTISLYLLLLGIDSIVVGASNVGRH